uniref:Glycosyl transferase family 3 domain-containing protein n=1 Tax=Rhodosorus marinus TaxID=101924 RepID=A0A7S3AA39_9RHOD|mmetsp:Transcript_8690/g.38673  ORF Transcript_8690/g.38673 Transcript_8690/m.38673 type:complete len:287 (+) Transcript_8690:352-1212(+)
MGDGCFIGQGLTVDRRRSGELQVCGRRWRSSRGCVVWSMKPVLERLAGLEDLSEDDVSSAMGEVLDGDASPEELAVFLALLRAKKETATEVAAIANAMKSRMLPVETRKDVLEIVGTGGDGADTVNISTMAAVLSAACGATVAKHGNRSISSKSGSADVLEAIGIPLDLSPEGVAQCIDKVGIGFMFAPTHHPAMKTVQPVRRSMKIRSVFNIMGPLLNPAGAQRGIIGVYSPSVMNLMADTLVELGKCIHRMRSKDQNTYCVVNRAVLVINHSNRGGVDESESSA